MKKKGFTLAEVLISLGIIGVVSAITMPALTANYQKKTYEAGIKKVYNTVSVAIETYMANEGIDDLLDSDLVAANTIALRNQRAKDFMANYFKVAQDCDTRYYNTSGAKCFAKEYKTLDRKKTRDYSEGSWTCNSAATLTDGTAICLDIMTPGAATYGKAMSFTVDINGLNGPNISGRDLFAFDVNSAGKVYQSNWGENVNATLSAANWVSSQSAIFYPGGIGKLMSDGWQMLY